MQNSKMLEMLNKGRTEELKALLQDEIYQESLKKKPDAKRRYAAMKKYFGYINAHGREVLCKPCEVEFEGKKYTSFTNSHSLVLTTEPTGEIEHFNTENGNYPEVGSLIHFDGDREEIDILAVIAEAKSKGYKLKKDEVGHGFKYLMYYDDTYYKIGLIDASYNIIADGKKAIVYHKPGTRSPLTIETDYGYCVVMPIHIKDDETLEVVTVIEVDRVVTS